MHAGYMQLLTVRGVPVYVHWSLAIPGVAIAAIAGFHPYEAVYCVFGFVALIVAHEMGHVMVAAFCGQRIFSIAISGAGGECRYQPTLSVARSLAIVSGGLLAQAALFLATLSYLSVAGETHGAFERCMVTNFTVVNLLIFVINILPIKARSHQHTDGYLATDGYVIWQLFLHKFRGHPHPYSVSVSGGKGLVFSPVTSMLSMDELVPAHFSIGIEILNDRTTPMEFVVEVLGRRMELSRDGAIEIMLGIHNNGGVLLFLTSKQRAEKAASEISADAIRFGHTLVCRAVDRGDAKAGNAPAH